MKTFYYQFEDPHFIRSIQVNVIECPTISDLTKKIASFFNLSYYHLIVENQPNEKQLEKITEKFIFVIKFPNRRTDITFFFPKNKTINLQNGYRLNYNQIIHSFQENHFYYSDECARNYLQFMIFDKELPHIEFPLIAIPSGICINVKLQCEQVILTYNENYFTFTENEMALEAFNLIKEVYNGCHSVSIQTNESRLSERDSLRRFVTYTVGVYYKIVFKNIENWSEETLLLDFLSTVSDAQKQLFARLGNNEISNASKVTIYNGNMQIINDNNLLLKNIQDFSNFFYFEIKKKSPEKVTPKKANYELDPKFSYTPNRKTKASYIDYSKTPELKIRSDYNHDIAFYSKTPEKLPNSFYNTTFSDTSEKRFDSDLNKKKSKKSNKKSNLNSSQKSSTKLKSSNDNTNLSMNFNIKSNANSEIKLNNKTANSSTSQNKIATKLNTKTPNKSLNKSNFNVTNKPSTTSKISVNETKFNSSQKSSTNSKNQSNSISYKKTSLNSVDKSHQQSNTIESIKLNPQESTTKNEFDDDYDEYFENSSSRNNQTKDNIDDIQQSLELDELKKLLNEEEEEEFHEKNKDINSNGQVENDEVEEEEFNENYNSETSDHKDNIINNEEEDILSQSTKDQNKIDDLSNDDAFFVEADDFDISNSNQDENSALDIFEEEEE